MSARLSYNRRIAPDMAAVLHELRVDREGPPFDGVIAAGL